MELLPASLHADKGVPPRPVCVEPPLTPVPHDRSPQDSSPEGFGFERLPPALDVVAVTGK